MATINQVCRGCKVSFPIYDEDQAFYAKMGVPLPTLCPSDRMQKRMSFRNERKLYLRKCDLSGKQIVSIYSPDKTFSVYDQKLWWSDLWNPFDFGREFDFSKTFFQQLKALQMDTPRLSIFNQNCENSDYTNQSYDNKNCYLCSAIGNSNGLLYVQNATFLRDSLDVSYGQNGELLYECIDTYDSYHSLFLQQCIQCSDSWFLYDCVNCKNCFGCIGLRNKEYHIANEPYTKDEYEKKIASFGLNIRSNLEKCRDVFLQNLLRFPHVSTWLKNSENVSGNNIKNSRNSFDCFDVFEIEDCRYCTWIFKSKDVYDCYGVGKSHFSNESIGSENINHVSFSTVTSDSQDSFYLDLCFSCKDCFGCIGLKHAQYCILNKQYTKEEYEILLPRIIEYMKQTGEWGEFFPVELSPFAYNETIAQEYFPLSKEEILSRGYSWKDSELNSSFEGPTSVTPENILEVEDSILEKICKCESCGKNYKIIRKELELHQSLGVPFSVCCSDCRYLRRIQLRNPRHLWDRACKNCEVAIQTTYAPNRPETVYCEACYLKTVY